MPACPIQINAHHHIAVFIDSYQLEHCHVVTGLTLHYDIYGSVMATELLWVV